MFEEQNRLFYRFVSFAFTILLLILLLLFDVQCSVFGIRVFSHWNYIQNDCTIADCRLRKRIHKSNKGVNLLCFWFIIQTGLRYCYRFAISNQMGTQFQNENQNQKKDTKKPNIHDFAFRQGENKNINTWNYGHIQPIQLQQIHWMHKLFFSFTNINCSSFVFLLILHVVWCVCFVFDAPQNKSE